MTSLPASTILIGLLIFAAIMALLLALSGPVRAAMDFLFGDYQAEIAVRLERTFSPLTPAGFVMLQIGVAIGLGAIGALFGPTSYPGVRVILAVIFGVVGVLLTFRFLQFLRNQYQKRFDEQFPEAIGMVANAVKAGLSVIQALEMVAQEFDAPLGTEMKEIVQELRLGIPIDVALQDWGLRVRSDDLDIFVIAVVIQRQTGGNLAEVLDNLGSTIRERRRIQGQIRTLTAQGRLSGRLLTVLPIVLGLMIQSIAPQYGVIVLFRHPVGWALLGLAVLLILIGAYMINRITNIDV